MTSARRDDIAGRPSADDGTVRSLERAQLVWRRAVALSTSERDDERFGTVLDLLRAAHYAPSTMLHALALGREQQRLSPGDVHTRDAMRLLARTTEWLGKPTDQGEVGTAGAASERRT